MDNLTTVELYTDGACSGTRGRGGWAGVIICGNVEKEIYGFEDATTANAMELRAAIEGLKCLKFPCKVTLYSDSQLVVRGMNDWLKLWKARGWRKANNKSVAHAELWQELEQAARPHDVTFEWIRGHDGNHYNELADSLAYSAMEDMKVSR